MLYGITAEYNPFHAGHLYHLTKTRKNEDDGIVVVMSGNFVQRGEPAVCDMQQRAETAVRYGADLVVQLPTLWSACSAERFAEGGLQIMRALGVECVSFGAENADVKQLAAAAAFLSGEECQERLKSFLALGLNYPTAMSMAAGRHAKVLAGANNLLGIEYMKAAAKLQYDCEFLAVERYGVDHDAAQTAGKFASAGQIRHLLAQQKPIDRYVPMLMRERLQTSVADGAAPASLLYLERAILARLRTMPLSEMAALPDVSEGLHNRLFAAAQKASTLSELLQMTKTKRYTMARLRRIVLFALLGISAADLVPAVPYIRPLALNERGQEILRNAKANRCPLPIFAKSTSILDYPTCAQVFEKECTASSVYALCLPDPSKGVNELTRTPRRL
ncbi:MAG: nucleotidyltransferase family protein [Clostridia bacterium]|nr:nucleotidyltransferase family protein [Clostridia bacterium]